MDNNLHALTYVRFHNYKSQLQTSFSEVLTVGDLIRKHAYKQVWRSQKVSQGNLHVHVGHLAWVQVKAQVWMANFLRLMPLHVWHDIC